MQGRADIWSFQHPPKPVDLVRGLKKRVIAVDGRVLPLDDILDLADRFGGRIPDSLDMLGNEQEMMGIDMAVAR